MIFLCWSEREFVPVPHILAQFEDFSTFAFAPPATKFAALTAWSTGAAGQISFRFARRGFYGAM
jgi:hypothetical protein